MPMLAECYFSPEPALWECRHLEWNSPMVAIHRLSRFVLELRFSLTSFRGGESAFIDCVVIATIVRNRIALWCRVLLSPAISISTCNLGQLDLAKKGTTILCQAGRDLWMLKEYTNLLQQDKVNSADSAFIFLIIQSQNQWSGWSRRRSWSCLVWYFLER